MLKTVKMTCHNNATSIRTGNNLELWIDNDNCLLASNYNLNFLPRILNDVLRPGSSDWRISNNNPTLMLHRFFARRLCVGYFTVRIVNCDRWHLLLPMASVLHDFLHLHDHIEYVGTYYFRPNMVVKCHVAFVIWTSCELQNCRLRV